MNRVNNVKDIAVISLTNELDRRQHIDALFDEYKLDFSYFDAINKLKVADTLKKYGLTVNTEKMSTGEVACYLSHYCLWQQVVEYNMPYLMIFEDDIYFSKSAKVLLKQLDWLPSSFNIIKLETMYQRVLISKGTSLPIAHRLSEMKSRHMGTAGYILSQEGAKKLISMTKKLGINQPVDQLMFNQFLKQKKSEVYQVFPALCIQDKIYNKESVSFGSELEEIRETSRKLKLKPSSYQKIIRELIKIYQQLLPRNIYYAVWFTVHGYKKRKIEYYE